MPPLPFSRSGSTARRYVRTPDTELISACLSGKADAWDALVERYEALIYALPIRMGLSESDAQDIFQD